MLTDYKTPWIQLNDDGSWDIKLQIYEGDTTTEDEDENGTGNVVPVTRYRRVALVREEQLHFPAISERALSKRLRVELAKDRTRTPIPEQHRG